MPAPRNRKHIFIQTPPSTEGYRPHPRKIMQRAYPGPTNRERHAAVLRDALTEAKEQAQTDRDAVGFSVYGAQPGLYIEFQSPPDFELKLESLGHKRKGIEVVNVRSAEFSEGVVQFATVFVPDGELKHFFNRFRQYEQEKTPKGEPRHKDLLDRITALRKATFRAMWTDSKEVYPGDEETIWWEVWLRRHDGRELKRLQEFAEKVGLDIDERYLGFDDRIVILVKGTSNQLSASLDVLNDLAEVRRAKQSAAFFIHESPEEQAEWVEDLRRRVILATSDAPAVCILDTGITRAHPLLEDLIAPADAMTVNPKWGVNDNGGGPESEGHGTEMAGLAAYGGDLVNQLRSSTSVRMRHCLESVKILPPRGANHPELYGAITAEAVAYPEVNKPNRLRVFSMAVTATDKRDRGEPTSWSAAIDALASGRTFDSGTKDLVYLDKSGTYVRRLFILSAGNVETGQLQDEYLNRCDLESIHDPAHAWNALTVGAHTEKSVIEDDPDWEGWSPLAPHGELSPWSTTSVIFEDQWAVKPDVVCEGGNAATDGKNFDGGVPDLCLLSTYYKPILKAFVLSQATSAATAQVARIAAIIMSDYPEYWPETVRALIVHSAQWTNAMNSRFGATSKKKKRAKLIRRYGFGVPDLNHALRSANDALTLVTQAVIHPFSEGTMREMHLHELPWPKDILEALGQTEVRLRVTLSYFIEPNPSRRGWKKRHRYASHGLRFELKTPTETVNEFRKRLNKMALDEEDTGKPNTGSGTTKWFLGSTARNKGSIHSDMWTGTAVDLARTGVIGIYPVSGWWKDQPKRDRSEFGAHYGLVVSIETKAENIDIWTPVAQEVGIPVEEILVDI